MARIFAIVNQKGGVGKTTTAVNLAATLADEGKRVLLIDSDAQTHAGKSIGFTAEKTENTLYNVLNGTARAEEAISKTDFEDLFLLPSDIRLSSLEVELATRTGKEFVLERALRSVKDSFDYIVIDCPPFLGVLTINALIASTDVIITSTMSYLSLEGVSDLLDLIEVINDTLYLPKKVRVSGVLACMYDARTKIARKVRKELERYFEDLVFDVVIPTNVTINEAQTKGVPVIHFDANALGARAYRRLTHAVIKRLDEKDNAGTLI